MAQVQKRQAEVSGEVNGGTGEETYLHFAFIEPIKPGKFGGGLMYLHASDGLGRSDTAAQFTYGQYVIPGLSFGGTIRWQSAKTAAANHSNFGFDIGAMYHPQTKDLKNFDFALTAMDVNSPTFKGIGIQERTFNAAIAYHPDNLTVLDLDWYDIGSVAKRGQARLGAERQMTKNIALRAGVAQSTFGVGLSLMYKWATIDYGFQREKGTNDLNVVSLTCNF
jgi:hypothetical protein